MESKNEVGHTPTPWYGDECLDGTPAIFANNDQHPILILGEDADVKHLSKAVRAANAHDALVGILQEILPMMESGYIANHSYTAGKMRERFERDIKSALKLAEGEGR